MSGIPNENGTPIRFPSVALLCVDSADGENFNTLGLRTDTNQPNRIYINKQRPLAFGYMTRIALTEFNIQWNTPNVNLTNNTLTLRIRNSVNQQVQDFTTTIPESFYGPSNLCNTLAILLNGSTAITTFLNANAGAGVFSVTLSSSLQVTITANASPGWNAFTFRVVPTPNVGDDLTNMLGLTPTVDDAFVTTLTGGYASFQYTPYIDITSNFLTKNQNIQDGDSAKKTSGQKLARIYLSNEEIVARYEKIVPVYSITTGLPILGAFENNIIGCAPFVFKREFKTPKYIQWNTTENIDVVDIEVLDYKGNPLYISPQNQNYGFPNTPGFTQAKGNTSDIQFTIQVSEV